MWSVSAWLRGCGDTHDFPSAVRGCSRGLVNFPTFSPSRIVHLNEINEWNVMKRKSCVKKITESISHQIRLIAGVVRHHFPGSHGSPQLLVRPSALPASALMAVQVSYGDKIGYTLLPLWALKVLCSSDSLTVEPSRWSERSMRERPLLHTAPPRMSSNIWRKVPLRLFLYFLQSSGPRSLFCAVLQLGFIMGIILRLQIV